MLESNSRSDLLTFLSRTHATFKERLPPQATQFSPKKYTQPQLITLICLLMLCEAYWNERRFGKPSRSNGAVHEHKWIQALVPLSYRKLTQLLREDAAMRAALGIRYVPHHTTLYHARARFPMEAFLRAVKQ
ncbi:MAG TPA: transposase [Tepidisphaeraceae bacterium]|nr:transposase [Tepidisphaeraceae bacterium]